MRTTLQQSILRVASLTRASRALLAVVLVSLASASALRAQQGARGETGFQPGDRIVLRVTGEPLLTDTFTVVAGPAVVLPIVGTVALGGVQRDSLEIVLTAVIAKFYRDPNVRARALLRVAILGEVLKPGFYFVPSDLAVADVLMAAGGPTPFARLDAMQIMRSGTNLVSVDSARKAFSGGLTITQVGIHSDDTFLVPRTADPERTIRIVSALITIVVAIATTALLMRR